MFDIQSLDGLLDRGISGNDVHTVVISDPNGAPLTFVDTVDTTSEAQNRRVRVVAALGIDAWRESVSNSIEREALVGAGDESLGSAMGRVECEVRLFYHPHYARPNRFHSVGTRLDTSSLRTNRRGARPSSLGNP